VKISGNEELTFEDKWFPKEGRVWCPRLTAGIYAVSKALGVRKTVLPNNCCPSVVYGLLLANVEPVFCEIDISNGGLDSESLSSLMEKHQIDMVIMVHLYGLYQNREMIHEICKKHNSFLFEDGGLWFPPVTHYSPLVNSCLGFSFGEKKVFDFGRGGLLLFQDQLLSNKVTKILKKLPILPSKPNNYSQSYYNEVGIEGLLKSKNQSLEFLAFRYKDYWIGNCSIPNIELAESKVIQEKKRRDALVQSYKKILSFLNVDFFVESSMDFPWRFSFLSSKARQLADRLRENDINVSHWYPSLNRLFPKFSCSVQLSNSHKLSDEVCNLWLDDSITEQSIAHLQQVLQFQV
jgi:dTDP-4-amino-4,6-dideoxygalactose transaminase